MAEIETTNANSTEQEKKPFFSLGKLNETVIVAVVTLLSFLVTLFVFLPALGSKFLLDEQFIAVWSKDLLNGTANGGWGSYLYWRGPSQEDAFGPLASISCLLLSQMGEGMARLVAMIAHAACGTALYMVSRKLTKDFGTLVSLGISIFAALIFSIHTLSAEQINFLGGFGIELSVLFFTLSLNAYLSAHPIFKGGPQNTAQRNAVLSVVFFVCACLAYSKSWYLLKIIAIFEIFNFALDSTARSQYKQLFKDSATPGRMRFFATLACLTVASLSFMFIEMARGFDPIGSIASMLPNGIKSSLLSTMFPINRSILTKYSSQYIFLYVIYGLAAALSVYGLFRNQKYRVVSATALAWVFFGLMIGGNHSLVADDFYGHRFLAHAQAGISLLMPLLCFGLACAISRGQAVTAIPAAVVCLLLMIAFCRNSFVQCQHYKGSGQLLAKIQKSVSIICAKQNSPYCVTKDLPRRIAFVPEVSPFLPIVIDAKNGLMRAPTVSGGALKDALRAGRMVGSTARWDTTFDSLVPIVIDPKTNDPSFALDAQKTSEAMSPPLQFWKTVSLDSKEGSLNVTSNSEHEPGIGLFSRTLSPLDGDIFYVDAKISTPVEPANPNVELHWMTLHTGNYEKEDRRALTLAKLNDNQYHRHLLSLRGTGWPLNGPATQLTIGFPSSSSVHIKGIGIIPGDDVFPKIKVIDATPQPVNSHRFTNLCFDYPDDSDLGLFYIDKNKRELNFSYDASAIAGSAKCVIFSTAADQLKTASDDGKIPNDSAFQMTVSETKGSVKISLDNFEKAGAPTSAIYGLRVAAFDSGGNQLGKFSDTIWLLADRSK
jgi:hypothetical protein